MPEQIVWLSTVQAAYRLGTTSERVRKLIAAEKLPAEYVGRVWRIREDHLTTYQQETRRA